MRWKPVLWFFVGVITAAFGVSLMKHGIQGLIILIFATIFSAYQLSLLVKLYKLTVGLTFFYSVVSLVNYLGYDDKSIILYTLSPVAFLKEKYFATVLFGFLLGFVADTVLTVFRKIGSS